MVDFLKDRVKILNTRSNIGHGHNRTVTKFSRGPLCQRYPKEMKYSQLDYVDPEFRKDLKIKSGINQKATIFLGTDTYLTLEDLWELSNAENMFMNGMWLSQHKTKSIKKSKSSSSSQDKKRIKIIILLVKHLVY